MRTIKTFEAFVGGGDSSIKEVDAKSYNTLLNELCEKINSIEDESKKTELEGECNKRLDVYDKEPLPQDHKLRFLPNALLLPHIGYVTVENYSKFYLQMVENLLACVNNKPVRIIS